MKLVDEKKEVSMLKAPVKKESPKRLSNSAGSVNRLTAPKRIVKKKVSSASPS